VVTEPANPTLRNLPQEERPRERLFKQGPAALSTTELLAILLGTGNRHESVLRLAERVLVRCGGLNGLLQTTPTELNEIHGMGQAKVAQVMAAIEIGKRLMTASPDKRPMVRTSGDAARLMLDMSHLTQEQVRVILLDTSRRVIDVVTVYIGTVSTAVLRAAEIYREAITRNAPGLILVHNHPSGDPTPSPEDVELTHRLRDAGDLLDISLLDHIIIGAQEWRSLREMGLGFTV
jgi:DNA repair protein RadC